MSGVHESRGGRSLSSRPLLLVGGAVVLIIVAVVIFSTRSSPPSHPSGSASSASGHSGSSGSSSASLRGFFVKTSTPAAGAQNVASNTAISVTFSKPVTLGKVTPHLVPSVAGKWVRTGNDTLTYELDSPLIPSSHEVLTIPGGTSGVHATDGATVVVVGLLLVQRRGRRHAAPAADAGAAELPAPELHADRSRTEQGRPGHGSARELRLALAQHARRAHVAVDPGHREHDQQGRRRGLRDPERDRRGRHRRPRRVDRPDQRHHQRQVERDALRLRPREQGVAPEPDAVEQRGRPIRRHPRQHGRSGRRYDRRHLCRLRARALLGDEGDQPRRLDLRRPQRPLRQLLQRWRRAARVHPGPLRLRRRATAASR